MTKCGHLYCWPCLYQWLEPGMSWEERQEIFHNDDIIMMTPGAVVVHAAIRPDLSRRVCPTCKAPCSVSTLVPIFVHEQKHPKDNDNTNHNLRNQPKVLSEPITSSSNQAIIPSSSLLLSSSSSETNGRHRPSSVPPPGPFLPSRSALARISSSSATTNASTTTRSSLLFRSPIRRRNVGRWRMNPSRPRMLMNQEEHDDDDDDDDDDHIPNNTTELPPPPPPADDEAVVRPNVRESSTAVLTTTTTNLPLARAERWLGASDSSLSDGSNRPMSPLFNMNTRYYSCDDDSTPSARRPFYDSCDDDSIPSVRRPRR